MRILGIDPGIQITGYSILDVDGENYNIIASGSIRTEKEQGIQNRLSEIFHDIISICKMYEPDCAAIEELFFFKNQKTIIPVAEARGVILAALNEMNVSMGEYTPLVVKQVITGHGRATKEEVRDMVKRFVELNKNTKLDDTVDSIAIAICHARNLEAKRG